MPARAIRRISVPLIAMALALAAASPAMAAPTFAAGEYPATVSGEAIESQIFKIGANELTCVSSTVSGTMTEAEPMLTLTPAYAQCQATVKGNLETANFRFYKCFYTLSVTQKAMGMEITHAGLYNLICGESEEVELEIVEKGKTVCLYTLAGASELSEMQYGTMASGLPNALTAYWLVSKIPYKRKVGTATLCGAGSGEATYTGATTLRAKNGKGALVNLEVTG